MNIAKASGATLYVTGFAKQQWHLPLLTVRDLGELQRMVPAAPGRAYADIFEIAEWSRTVEGSHEILLRSLRKREATKDITLDGLCKLGSLAERVKLASVIVMESLVSGEEETEPESGQKKSPPSPATG